jgi:hypothetical protein
MKNKGIIALLSILVIVLGFFAYLFATKKVGISESNMNSDIAEVENVSNLDDVDTIEDELDSTDIDNLDNELESIEKEINDSL